MLLAQQVSGFYVNLSSPMTWIILVGLIAAGFYVWRHYRQRLLDMIPDPIEQLLRSLGINLGQYLDGGKVVDNQLPMIAAMDTAVRTLLQQGLIDDAKIQEDLRYRLMVNLYTQPLAQSASFDIDALAKKVAEQISSPKAGGAA